MANTALNRTVVTLLTNKSGGTLNYGDVVITGTATAQAFTTTTTGAISTTQVGVIIEPAGIANNAIGQIATAGWVPRVNLNTAATLYQFLKTHTVAGQATPHSSPQVEGDFGIALDASATPSAILFGAPNGPTTGGAGTVTHTGALTANALVIGNGTDDIKVTTTGTGIVTALGVNTGSAGAPALVNGVLGTPSSGTLTNCDYPGKLIAVTKYAPASDVLTSTTSTTVANIDAANLTITFTVPASGNVVVGLSAFGDISTNAQKYYWTLLNGAALVTGAGVMVRAADGVQVYGNCLITGLTPGASLTWTWAHGVTGGATGRHWSGPGVTSTTVAGNMAPPAVMTIRTAP